MCHRSSDVRHGYGSRNGEGSAGSRGGGRHRQQNDRRHGEGAIADAGRTGERDGRVVRRCGPIESALAGYGDVSRRIATAPSDGSAVSSHDSGEAGDVRPREWGRHRIAGRERPHIGAARSGEVIRAGRKRGGCVIQNGAIEKRSCNALLCNLPAACDPRAEKCLVALCAENCVHNPGESVTLELAND